MKKISAALVLVSAVILTGDASGKAANGLKIGQIIIVGNEVTQQEVILRALELYSAQDVRVADLRAAEKRLRELGIFASDPRPTVNLLDLDKEGEFKDLLVTVRETVTESLRLTPGITSRGEMVVSLVWEERNLDLWNYPSSMAECISGKSFKGAGQLVRVELFQLRVFPVGSPRLFRLNQLPFAPPCAGMSAPVNIAGELSKYLFPEK